MTAGGLIIRCDANTDIGAGHFFRQLALAEAAIDHGMDAVIVMHRPPAAYPDIAAESAVEVRELSSRAGTAEDAAEIQQLAGERDAAAVVVDGYHFDTAYYDALSNGDFTLAAVDDIAHQRFPVDVLVNVNPHAKELDYDVPAQTRMLLGVDYALLRRQFRQARARLDDAGGPEVPDEVSRIIVTMGGGDPTNETGKVLQALKLADYRGAADVVIGPSNPHRDQLETLADHSSADISFHVNVRRMAELMSRQHLALCASGGTSWELCCLGVPMIQMVIADNQRPIADWLAERGVTRCAGRPEGNEESRLAEMFEKLDADHTARDIMSGRGLLMVDGRGAERILTSLNVERPI